MVGIIITGHGNFASGLNSSLELIAGKQEHLHVVDFLPEDSVDNLRDKLAAAMDEMKDLKGVIVLSDLAGGSPMKTAVMLSLERKNVHVLAGTNLPLVLEATLMRTFQDDLKAFASTLVETGKTGVVLYELQEKVQDTSGDGI